jgi:hypothetical protein
MSDLKSIITEYDSRFDGITNTKEQGKIFARWYLENIEDNGITNDEIDDYIIDSTGDGGVDAFYYNDENQILYLYQFKYKSSGDLSLQEQASFKDLLLKIGDNERRELWLDSTSDSLDTRLVDYLRNAKNFVFKYITSVNDFNLKNFEESCLLISDKFEKYNTIKVLGEKQLKNLFNNESSDKLVPLVDNDTKKINQFEYKSENSGISAYIMNLAGDILVDKFAFDEYFNSNIRSFIGENPINRGMIDTAKNHADLFWFYNNGVTIVCDEINRKGGSIKVRNAQVVNGAQTINSLKRVTDKEKLKQIRVLAKILEVKSSNEKILNDIVKYTNTQNKIDRWQFFSNKPLWKVLREYFLNESNNEVDLIYKVGIKSNATNKIKLTEFISACIAFFGDPQVAKKGQSAIFKNDNTVKEYFDKVFEEFIERENESQVPKFILERFYLITNIFINSRIALKKIGELKVLDAQKVSTLSGIDTVLKHSRFYILFLINDYIKRSSENQDNNLLNNINLNLSDFITVSTDEVFLPIWKNATSEDKSLISNAPKFVKSEDFNDQVRKKSKAIDYKIKQSFEKNIEEKEHLL